MLRFLLSQGGCSVTGLKNRGALVAEFKGSPSGKSGEGVRKVREEEAERVRHNISREL